MATDLEEELSRLQNVALRLTAELGGKNEKLKHMGKMLEENSTSLSRMTEKRDHLNRAYNEEKRKMKRTMDKNERLMREFEAQRKEIEQQAKEIEKRDAQLDFKSKELQVLRMLKNGTQDSQKINTVQGKHGGVGNLSSRDKVQVQNYTNGLQNELEVKDYELDNELSQKQTLVGKEHRSNHELQEARKVSIEASRKITTVQGKPKHGGVGNMSSRDKVQVQIDTNGLHNELEVKDYELDSELSPKQTLVGKEYRSNHDLQEARKVSIEASRKITTVQGKPKHQGVETESSRDKVQVQIDTNGLHNELDEKAYELDNEVSRKQIFVGKEHRSNRDLQEACKVSIEKVTKEDDEKPIEVIEEWGKGDIEGSGGVECNAFQDTFPPIPPSEYLVDPCNDMSNNSSDLSTVLPGSNVTKEDDEGKGDIEGSGGVECDAFQDMSPPIPPTESLVDPGNDMLNNNSYLSSALPVPDDEIAELEWLSTFVDDSLSAGGITVDIDYSNNNKKDNSATVLKNSSSCSGGKTMPPTPDTVVPTHVRNKRPRSAVFYEQPAPNLASHESCLIDVEIQLMPNFNGKEQKKKKKKKRLPPCMPSYSSGHGNSLQQQQQPGVACKKCLHCEVTKTAVWRGGPMGAGTLCNACGVRYKSGLLFPEYHPKASPTFVASKRINSHKKVLEARVKGTPARCIQLQSSY
ncbi:hypothetical protein MKW98_019950 [Papaver atlanticum]|uniref:GATA-type domain-containing protein n=1 Tax=Papaver atlanticum TaxID=357466 RepID=A0AAD4S2J9_9MAGN|nr:hypothetical protein MKW98_019950 [Papaver atlanticum]